MTRREEIEHLMRQATDILQRASAARRETGSWVFIEAEQRAIAVIKDCETILREEEHAS